MLIINVKESESLDKALKKFKKKFVLVKFMTLNRDMVWRNLLM
jgi:ribosomal protein S21